MEIKEIRKLIKDFGYYHSIGDLPHSYNTVQAFEAADAILAEAQQRQDADGCSGCTFIDTEEWEMPCAKCKRACKDYWRQKP